MAPPRKHETDAILDATRELVLRDGPRAASVAAIAQASGAPTGTLYHRFGSRDGVLMQTWLRALHRFQDNVMAVTMGADPESATTTAVEMGVAALRFAREMPDDARLLLLVRPRDLVDGQQDGGLLDAIAKSNAPLEDRINGLTRIIYGGLTARTLDTVRRAVVDLPYAMIRRHANDDSPPDWLEADLAANARAVLAHARPRGGLSGE